MDSGFAQFDVENAMKFVPIPAHLSLSVEGVPLFFPSFGRVENVSRIE